MSVARSDVIKLYRALLRHGGKFADYNFREYAVRRTRHAFATAKTETDPAVIKQAYYDGLNTLAVVKRQSSISQMFAAAPTVLEQQQPGK